MILPDLILPSRAGQNWSYSGMDCIEQCLDKEHFKAYQHDITYKYNSRGFRDAEWPDSTVDLKNAIWCVGDSFTVGVGSTLAHTWPRLLSADTGQPVINISMDGASNMWISRHAELIQNEIDPKKIIIMWSYVHRRELCNQKLDSEARRLRAVKSNHHEDLINFKHCLDKINDTNAIQLVIPDYCPNLGFQSTWEKVCGVDWPVRAPTTLVEMSTLPEFVQVELKNVFNQWENLVQSIEQQNVSDQLYRINLEKKLIKINRLDLARDGHHFDLITSQWVVDQIIARLN